MKLAVVGGGSTYTPELVDGFARLRDDAAGRRAGARRPGRGPARAGRRARAAGSSRQQGHPARLTTTTDLDAGGRRRRRRAAPAAGRRPGGARTQDETWPLECGCVGQETTGAGGLAKALRTVPVVLDIAERVRDGQPGRLDRRLHQPGRHRHPRPAAGRAPGGRAVQRGDRLPAAVRRAARASTPSGVRLDHVGLNHLTWERARAASTAWTVLPELLAEHGDEIADGPRAAAPGCCASSASVPSYYLRYFYAHDEVVRELRASAVAGRRGGRDRATSCCEMYADPALDDEAGAARAARRRVLLRGGGGAGARRCSAPATATAPGGERAQRRHPAVPARRRGHRGAGARSAAPGATPAAGRAGRAAVRRADRARHRVRAARARRGAARRPGARLRGAARPPAGRPGRPRRRPDRPADRPQPGATCRGRDASTDATAGVLADRRRQQQDRRRGGRGGRRRVLGTGARRRLPRRTWSVPSAPSTALGADRSRGGALAGAPATPPLVGHVSACLANADLPVEEVQIADSMRARGWGDGVHVANDTFALLRAGTDEPRGVAVVCGAGINCVGLLPDGRTARFPALGHISGDWGGGGPGAGGDVVGGPRRGRPGAGDRARRRRRRPLRAAERDGGGRGGAPAAASPRAAARAGAGAVPGGRRR